MTLWVCLDCTAAYSVGAPLCPQCRSERRAEEGAAAALGIQHGVPVDSEEEHMPKITRHGGPSIAGVEPETDAGPEATPESETEGGEDVSAGSSSETSSEKPPKKSEPNATGRRKPARTAGSRSRQDQPGAESSTAGSTDGSGPETGTADAPSE